MKLNNRLNKLEEQLKNKGKAKGEVRLKWVGCDGYYPEQEEDKNSNDTIIKICVEGLNYEEIRQWCV